MIVFPNCKINLGLHVVRKREDGYHDIETVFYPLPLKDALEAVCVRRKEEAGGGRTSEVLLLDIKDEEQGNEKDPFPSLRVYGRQLDGSVDENLCIKAWQLLKKDFPALPAVSIHLLKNIPIGAGLGGGSANGAFMLQLLNKGLDLHLTRDQLLGYAAQLGSDCPFFILNTTCYATGRGEQLQPLPLDLRAYRIIIVNPGIHVSTAWAFSQLSPAASGISLPEILKQAPETWRTGLCNDFEPAVFGQYPEIREIKEQLYAAGAIYAAMSGSGSTVFGLFSKNTAPVLPFSPAYTVIQL